MRLLGTEHAVGKVPVKDRVTQVVSVITHVTIMMIVVPIYWTFVQSRLGQKLALVLLLATQLAVLMTLIAWEHQPTANATLNVGIMETAVTMLI